MNNHQNDTQILRGILDDVVHLLPKHRELPKYRDDVDYYWCLLDEHPSQRLSLAWLFVAKVEALHATEVVIERTLPSPGYLRQRLDTLKATSQALNAPREMITHGTPQIPPAFFLATIVPEIRQDASENDARGVVIDHQKLGVDTPDPISWLFSEGQEFLDHVYSYACLLGARVRLQPPQKDLDSIYCYLKETWVHCHVKYILELDTRMRRLAAPKKNPVAIQVEDMLISSATSPD